MSPALPLFTEDGKVMNRYGKPAHLWGGVQRRFAENVDPSDVLPELKKNPYVVACPAPLCYFRLTAKTREQGERLFEDHKKTGCPHRGGDSRLAWSIVSDQLAKIWKALDVVVDRLYDPEIEKPVKVGLAGEARGLAASLAVFMPPFFHTTEDISREAKKRYEKRKAGEEYETPGIGKRRFETPDGGSVFPERVTGTAPPRTPTNKRAEPNKISKLSEDDRNKIRAAVAAGMPVQALALRYGLTTKQIEAL